MTKKNLKHIYTYMPIGAVLVPLKANAAVKDQSSLFSGLNKNLKDFFSCGMKDGIPSDLTVVGCIVNSVTNYLLDLVGIVAFIMVMYAAIIYLTSYGEEGRVELAKKTLIWSVIGIVVVTLSKLILILIKNALVNKAI